MKFKPGETIIHPLHGTWRITDISNDPGEFDRTPPIYHMVETSTADFVALNINDCDNGGWRCCEETIIDRILEKYK